MAEMNTMANTPADMKRGGRHGRHKDGGETGPKKSIQMYNAQGSEAAKSAEDETPDFKKGGRSKRKAGGMAEGGAAPMRADKAPRGNYARGGRTGSSGPYSSGRTLTAPSTDKAAMGHEGISVPPEPG